MAQYGKKAEALKLLPKMEDVETADLNWDKMGTDIKRLIDTELRGRYVLPFPTTGSGDDEQADEETIRQIAEYLMAGQAQNVRYTEDAPNRMPDNWFWKKGMELLYRVKAIKLNLDPDHSALDTSGTFNERRVKSSRANYPPSFNKGNELDWRKPVIESTGDRDQLDPDEYKAPF